MRPIIHLCIFIFSGKGHFGDVFLARAYSIKEGEQETLVAMKSLISLEESHQLEFRREIDLFGRVNHEHIVPLLGVCREAEPYYIITEYLDWVSSTSTE